jgi:endonuclease-3
MQKNKEKLIKKIENISEVFDRIYGIVPCALNYNTPFELLVATIMSAQCTDKRVNMLTPALFEKFPTSACMAQADILEIEKLIKPCGFYHAKAANIKKCAMQIEENFDGKVPDNMDDLTSLAGVGRKTANLILGDIYNLPAVVCDTHVIRLSERLGLSKNRDPKKLEFDLKEIIQPEKSANFCHQLVHHGRYVCMARKPMCEECEISEYCIHKR